eukprot:1319841-Amorphochlora_amoeboformis.AAC.1
MLENPWKHLHTIGEIWGDEESRFSDELHQDVLDERVAFCSVAENVLYLITKERVIHCECRIVDAMTFYSKWWAACNSRIHTSYRTSEDEKRLRHFWSQLT